MKKQKYTFEFIKQNFENEKYQLLTVKSEYINTNIPLNFICPNGHHHKITFSSWVNKRRCGKCREINFNKILKSFNFEKYTLLITKKEYKNIQQKLYFICPNGHYHSITWNNWQSGQRCRFCSKFHQIITHEIVNQSFNTRGYTLLSKNYINGSLYLKYICPNGHKHKITYNSWQRGHGCPKCLMSGTSKPEIEIQKYVMENYTDTIKLNDRTLIRNPETNRWLELDIYLPELNKAIEYGAEYYHSDDYTKWKDLYKQQWCREHGIELLVINEKDWIKNKDFSMIYDFIKNVSI